MSYAIYSVQIDDRIFRAEATRDLPQAAIVALRGFWPTLPATIQRQITAAIRSCGATNAPETVRASIALGGIIAVADYVGWQAWADSIGWVGLCCHGRATASAARGWALRPNDSILVEGRVRRLTRIVPYVGPKLDDLTYATGTRIAYEDDGTRRPWALVVEPGKMYEVVS